MPLERVEDLQVPPIVGETYLVRCLALGQPLPPELGIWPILGPLHEDLELLGVGPHHHYDPRFLSDVQVYTLCARDPADLHAAIRGLLHGLPSEPWDLAFGRVALESAGDTVVEEPRKCLRPMPLYPPERAYPWITELESLHADACLSACGRCPHRGLPVASIPPDKDGLRTCVGHGLRFGPDGRVVQRPPADRMRLVLARALAQVLQPGGRR